MPTLLKRTWIASSTSSTPLDPTASDAVAASTSSTSAPANLPARLPHSRYIPEEKRGWTYQEFKATTSETTINGSNTGTLTSSSSSNSLIASSSSFLSGLGRKKDGGRRLRPKSPEVGRRSSPPLSPVITVATDDTHVAPRGAGQGIVSPRAAAESSETFAAESSPLTAERTSSSSDSSSSAHSNPTSPTEPSATRLSTAQSTATGERHPDDLIYPSAYRWRPSRSDPNAPFIHPAHRNPSAKQAFYDTHFGSSSNWNGFLTSGKKTTKVFGFLKSDSPEATTTTTIETTTVTQPEEQAQQQLDSPVRPVADGGLPRKQQDSGDEQGTKRSNLHGGEELGARYSGFGIGMSLEDAVRTESIVSPREIDDAVVEANTIAAGAATASTGTRTEEVTAKEASSRAAAASPSRKDPKWPTAGWKTIAGAWDFLTAHSVDLLLHNHAHNQHQSEAITNTRAYGGTGSRRSSSVSGHTRRRSLLAPRPPPPMAATLDYAALMEPELIPTVQHEKGAHHYLRGVTGPVVILGGYRGSVLRSAHTDEMMWIPLKVGVGLRRPTLELGLDAADEEHSTDTVYSSDMVTHIGRLVDMGKRLRDRIASASPTAQVHTWGYDWRLSLPLSAARLIAYLESLYEAQTPDQSGNRHGAKVVAHSMGGLVALYALATAPDPRIFAGIVFASTPFQGTPNILGPFRYGDAALFNDTICSPRATFSFRSSFYLLPRNGRCFQVPAELEEEEASEEIRTDARAGSNERQEVQDEEREAFKDLDFLDPETWWEYGFSPCVLPAPSASSESSSSADKQHQQKERDETHADEQVGVPDGQLKAPSDDVPSTVAPSPAFADPTSAPDGAAKTVTATATARTTPRDPQTAAYLDRTLAEVRQFHHVLDTAFSEEKFQAGAYPPLMFLTSGRTPAVSGAVVGLQSSDDTTPVAPASTVPASRQKWQDDIANGDYSHMTYAPGDGLITRASSTVLPGQWGRLLVSREEVAPLEDDGGGPSLLPGREKKLAKLERMRVRLDGEGTVESAHRHVTLLSDVAGVGRCLEALRRAERVRSSRRTKG